MIVEAFCLETREIIPIGKYDAERHKTFLCQYNHKLMVKKGKVTKHHYAHYPGTQCSFLSHSKTNWHRQWQSIDPKNTEIYIKQEREKGKGKEKEKEEKHFADIVTEAGTVIEIQYSPISEEEICKREKFYKNLIWIFNVNNSHTNTSFICRSIDQKCIIKIERKYLLDTHTETYYDCGAYLLKKIEIMGQNWKNGEEVKNGKGNKRYVLCEIIEYSDFIRKHFEILDFVFPKDDGFDFAFTVDNLCVTYFDNKITKLHFETLKESTEKELNEGSSNYEPFIISKYIKGRYFLPF